MAVRLFTAVWPPYEVVNVLAALDRPDVPGLRWTAPDQSHVTLRFFGDAEPGDIGPLPQPRGVVAVTGPATVRLGRHVLAVPVAGLDELAAAWPQDRPFRGHLTLARTRREPVPPALVGAPLPGGTVSWPVERVTLVRSEVAPGGARDTVLRGA